MVFRERSEERFSRNAETELVCRLLLEKKKRLTRCVISVRRSRTRASLCTACACPDLARASRIAIAPSGRIGPMTSWLRSIFFKNAAAPEIYSLSLHDALPILAQCYNVLPQLDINNTIDHRPEGDEKWFLE